MLLRDVEVKLMGFVLKVLGNAHAFLYFDVRPGIESTNVVLRAFVVRDRRRTSRTEYNIIDDSSVQGGEAV